VNGLIWYLVKYFLINKLRECLGDRFINISYVRYCRHFSLKLALLRLTVL